nr:MAG TPA: hypothetical protein [Caudoviricetes sp.]
MCIDPPLLLSNSPIHVGTSCTAVIRDHSVHVT